MTSKTRRFLLTTLIALVTAAAGWFCWVVLTPTFGTVVRYQNQQPSLQVSLLHHRETNEDAEDMLQLAKLHFDNARNLEQLYWREPSLIEEHSNCWLVAFTRKVPVYRFLGLEEVVQPTDEAMFLSITKSNCTVRFGKWCR